GTRPLLRPVPPPAGPPPRARLGRPDTHRDGRVPHPRRYRHLFHPVRSLPVVPVGAEGGPWPRPVPPAAVGGQAAAGRTTTRSPPARAGLRREPRRLD